jgi:hypothetical protein
MESVQEKKKVQQEATEKTEEEESRFRISSLFLLFSPVHVSGYEVGISDW